MPPSYGALLAIDGPKKPVLLGYMANVCKCDRCHKIENYVRLIPLRFSRITACID